MNLFQLGNFNLHSGAVSRWKIECDALTSDDWECLAYMGLEKMQGCLFSVVIGIPNGGLRLAQYLKPYAGRVGPVLLVDDVLTTGKSMEGYKKMFPNASGLVVFARGQCPDWITPIFQM